jgi:glyoxalase family protein
MPRLSQPARVVHGLHHITAIAGPAQENLDFYAGVLGMRLVKRSVNQDDPGTYHLFYADAVGHPGSDLTFFPWDTAAPPRIGHGLANEVSLEIPEGTMSYWAARLEKYGFSPRGPQQRFGDSLLQVVDPHGLHLALVEPGIVPSRAFEPWDGGPVDGAHQIRGLYGAQVWERESAPTIEFMTSVLGFQLIASDGEWTRYGFPDAAGIIDLRETPNERRGAWGRGAVHHLAWRVDDEEHAVTVRAQVEQFGARPTPVIDRFWFKSVYFKEPGGVLFEIATEGPGFGVDEDPAHLGEQLVLPPFLESMRPQIEQVLPPLTLPVPARTHRSEPAPTKV